MRTARGKRISKVLVAVDFTPGSLRAVQRAARLPLAPDATLVMLHVIPADVPAKLKRAVEDGALLGLDDAASAALAAAAKTGKPGVKVVPRLAHGSAYVEIVRQARSEGTELTVIGRHGQRPIRDLFLGSTAERVVRKGTTPVLLASQPPRPYRHPLVALDLSDTSRRIVEAAAQLLEEVTDPLVALHTYDMPFAGPMTYGLSARDMAKYRRQCKDEAAQGLRRTLSAMADLGVRFRPVLRAGDPRGVLVDEIKKRRVDLIALGTHARSGIGHTLLGSVAAWVVRSARTDVLVVRPAGVGFELP